MLTRRQVIKLGAAGGAGFFLATKFGSLPTLFAQAAPGPLTLDPNLIPKYVSPLLIPPAMPRAGKIKTAAGAKQTDYYEIAVRQFTQQIIPPTLTDGTTVGPTPVWSYCAAAAPLPVPQGGTLHYPALTIEAKFNKPNRVKWINQLVDANGNYLPHLLPVDQTLHWANPPGPRDGHGHSGQPYTGPVPTVIHVHGAHVAEHSDGYPEAWYLPETKVPFPPEIVATTGTYYDIFKGTSPLGTQWTPGSAVFEYPNDQRATTLWYHDHALGMTRVNVYAGPAGFYILRGGPSDLVLDGLAGLPAVLPGPAPALGDLPGTKYYEIPIVIQDRSFNADGSLFYADSRAFFDGYTGPYIPTTEVSPMWNPEFFGNSLVVNGRTWPFLEVEPRRYRLRFLNGCNSRFLILKIVSDPLAARPAQATLPFWQIGGDGGFLPAPVQLSQLLMGLAERADVIVDFTGLGVGTELFLINEGPDEPFGGGVPGTDFPPSDPHTTGQVLKFKVVAATSQDVSVEPGQLTLPPYVAVGPATSTRQVSLNEVARKLPRYGFDGPIEALLGTVDRKGNGAPLEWHQPITENPALDATEVWEIFNFTEDAHPIHVHEVQFEVVNRESAAGVRAPEVWETGRKDTVISYPGEITRIKATFDQAGLYVWHCHILEHEDNEMMRPLLIGSTLPTP
jgi:bilirubin oxidase